MGSQPTESGTRVGVFTTRDDGPDALWNQCDGSEGQHGPLALCGPDRRADHLLCLGAPIPRSGRPGRRGVARLLRGRGTDRERLAASFRRLDRPPSDITVLFYEPPEIVQDIEYDVARAFAERVFGPDARATHPLSLPSMWRSNEPIDALRALTPTSDAEGLAIVTSGKASIPGHRARLAFLQRLREANVPFDLHGVDLPLSLGGNGPVESKHEVLRRARFTLAIENDAVTPGYVTEKLWDPLLAWSLPLYFGSEGANAMIPADAFLRLPDLGEAGIDFVRHALAHPPWRDERREAMARARQQVLGPLRLIEWLRHDVLGLD